MSASRINRGRGRKPKGGARHSVRFTDPDLYQEWAEHERFKALGFDSFSEYADFTFNLAHGRWKEYGFENPEQALDYLLAVHRGVTVPPPHLRRKVEAAEATLPLMETTAA
ncbi:hypothetical protein [Nonomuraea sp. JJY05]|uniref:hypothetical protein n=1 Tax=Nonomuraea sp. JJY05 TaxID=3350255 RepID=UPI00373E251E